VFYGQCWKCHDTSENRRPARLYPQPIRDTDTKSAGSRRGQGSGRSDTDAVSPVPTAGQKGSSAPRRFSERRLRPHKRACAHRRAGTRAVLHRANL
jgi:hypothetical protein